MKSTTRDGNSNLEDLRNQGTRHLARVDERLARLIEQVGPCRLPRRRGRYASLVRAIIGQQVSMGAARAIHGRLRAAAGGYVTAERLAALDTTTLRRCGLSRQKCVYIRDLTERVLDSRLRLEAMTHMSNEAVAADLTAVAGIGPWSVDMFLMFVLNRPDVLPIGDLGIRKGFMRVYGLRKHPTPERMRRLAEPWRPYRTVASWYLWRSLEAADADG